MAAAAAPTGNDKGTHNGGYFNIAAVVKAEKVLGTYAPTPLVSTMVDALHADFKGHGEVQKKLQKETPHYGNDIDYVDDIIDRSTHAV